MATTNKVDAPDIAISRSNAIAETAIAGDPLSKSLTRNQPASLV
jgi:hypothetical protein